MNFTAKLHTGDITAANYPVLVVPAFDNEAFPVDLTDLDKLWSGSISNAYKSSVISTEFDVCIVTSPHRKGIRRVAFVGMGRRVKLSYEVLRRVAGSAANVLRKRDVGRVAFLVEAFSVYEGDFEMTANVLLEGARLGSYVFDQFKNEKDVHPLSAVDLHMPAGTKIRHMVNGLDKTLTLTRSTILARDWGNTPSNYATPTDLAKLAKAVAKEASLTCRILEEKECRKLGMGSFLGVSQGSVLPPKFIVLEYKPRRFSRTLCMVGKAITFDTGGISLKQAEGMGAMKMDCCGGLAVIAAMRSIGILKPTGARVVGVVPACENKPSGSAINPGDILKSQSGISIEVLNTDAEGRLILADGLEYAIREYRPTAVLDVATLTGACVVALGGNVAGFWTNNEDMASAMTDAQEVSGESAWRMPLVMDYNDLLKSDCADIKNIGTRWGGAITAALFLKKFVKDTAWLHFDIAGPAINDENKPYIPKGASGYGARALYSFLEHWLEL